MPMLAPVTSAVWPCPSFAMRVLPKPNRGSHARSAVAPSEPLARKEQDSAPRPPRSGAVGLWRSGELGQHLFRRALARTDGAVHVAVPVRGRLGAGPVDASDRLAQRGAEIDQRAGADDGHRTAAVPLFGRPVELHDLDR